MFFSSKESFIENHSSNNNNNNNKKKEHDEKKEEGPFRRRSLNNKEVHSFNTLQEEALRIENATFEKKSQIRDKIKRLSGSITSTSTTFNNSTNNNNNNNKQEEEEEKRKEQLKENKEEEEETITKSLSSLLLPTIHIPLVTSSTTTTTTTTLTTILKEEENKKENKKENKQQHVEKEWSKENKEVTQKENNEIKILMKQLSPIDESIIPVTSMIITKPHTTTTINNATIENNKTIKENNNETIIKEEEIVKEETDNFSTLNRNDNNYSYNNNGNNGNNQQQQLFDIVNNYKQLQLPLLQSTDSKSFNTNNNITESDNNQQQHNVSLSNNNSLSFLQTSRNIHRLSKANETMYNIKKKEFIELNQQNLKQNQQQLDDYSNIYSNYLIDNTIYDSEIVTNNNQKFIDLQFPANSKSSILSKEDEKRNVEMSQLINKINGWKRVSEICKNPQLFIEGCETNDVYQGELGDCWFLSACSILSCYPEIINFCITYVPRDCKNGNGKYAFQFYKEGEWKTICIDDYLPVDKENRPVFAHCKDPDELWLPLLEKAYAKLHGSYSSLIGGRCNDALVDLTGGVSYGSIKLSNILVEGEEQVNQFWNVLFNRIESKNYLLSVSCSNRVNNNIKNNNGLLLNHQYAVLDCKAIYNSQSRKIERLIKIRNPWGESEWLGKWSDNSSDWTDEMKTKLDFKSEDDGIFWMDLNDFLKHWTELDIVRIFNYIPFRKLKEQLMSKSSTNLLKELKNLVVTPAHTYAIPIFNTNLLNELKNKREWNLLTRKGHWSQEDLTNEGYQSFNNPQYLFSCNNTDIDELVISLIQYDKRYKDDLKIQNDAIGLKVFDIGPITTTNTLNNNKRIINQTTNCKVIAQTECYISGQREASLELKNLIRKGRNYIIMPVTYQAGIETSFVLRTFIKSVNRKIIPEIKLETLPTPKQLQQSSTIVSVKGRWSCSDKSAGGSTNSLDWIQNKQYVLTLSGKTKGHVGKSVTIQVKLKQYQQESDNNNNTNEKVHSIYVYIVKCNNNTSTKGVFPVYEINANNLVNQKITFLTGKEFNITFDWNVNSLEDEHFILIPSTFRNGEEGHFDLTCQTTKDLQLSLKCINDICNINTIHSQWKGHSAGGCPNFDTWINNPTFLVTTTQMSGTIKFVLNQKRKSGDNNERYAIGLLLFDNNKYLENNNDPIVQTDPYVYAWSISMEVQLEANVKYYLMASTFNCGEEGEFEIVAISSKECNLKFI
ncbi:hypothetical protein ABK040_002734 [Willaertia magna]